jgi:hypothetical protein
MELDSFRKCCSLLKLQTYLIVCLDLDLLIGSKYESMQRSLEFFCGIWGQKSEHKAISVGDFSVESNASATSSNYFNLYVIFYVFTKACSTSKTDNLRKRKPSVEYK